MFTVRQATLADAALVSDIGIRTYQAHFGELWHYPEELDAFLAQNFSMPVVTQTLQDPAVCWLLCHKAEQLIGYARLNLDSLLAPTQTRGAELQKIYFLPGYAGNGYGQRLFEQVQQRAIDRRQKTLWLEVLQRNTGAQRFYQRQGLSICGETCYTSAQGSIGIWYMSKTL
ncbi:Protease synthase and sporulation negative regulatory protein PAI 1 [Serratia entomophila]|jgi:ribosomal protein S18 acetylase RimI-like enzyme|uniref:GNAT family N-acetyltransferase n=1 Tax=Serratia entomophila TaxID=42906 RepID=A0ABY5CWT5_9GAMM|nr:GNAT family N-acetyltransferase [Serratia entomophila]UIW19745.1 GNAT family N-acetyltransferase [Serratia entomophila]USV02268.1 GNAT family N-acetyltransferase [Serratia entomophila]CAI0717036.1 Protease synthase and sporulation negative regulatory protein PAI 1 [Serratia entomophila]CAI0743956.1 Protease synthase and sporulation negative regulatory protein PAI 1 [Serratia entomophila]CAI0759986.1 Protease synthase and sporulation negative regulatory protein PAI 1 [Serratia entomophila]